MRNAVRQSFYGHMRYTLDETVKVFVNGKVCVGTVDHVGLPSRSQGRTWRMYTIRIADGTSHYFAEIDIERAAA